MQRTRWRPTPPPGNVIKAQRTSDDGNTQTMLVAYIAEATRDGDKLHIRCEGPEGLLKDMPLPFEPPGIAAATDPAGFRFWWQQIHYSFDLPDPALIPLLPSALSDEAEQTVRRFIGTTRDLASASLMSDRGAMTVNVADDGKSEQVVGEFPKRDLQVGFTTLLRQCHGQQDEARLDVAYEVIRRAATAASDADAHDRLQQLYAWHGAVIGLRKRSLDQRVRDRLVSEEGWKVFEYEEPETPSELIRVFEYGDLIHWGKTREDVVSSDDDEYEAMEQRYAFFRAALGLAHITIGFGELARAVITPRTSLLLPA